jgi:predicted flap endonuclease-1-like 5' DNA nuclease
MTDKLSEIEDNKPAQAERLAALGLETTADLLREGATPADRRRIAAELGMSDSTLLRWVNHADLFRIRGIARQYADLLGEAGVDTVVELAQRDPANLAATLAEIDERRQLTERTPGETEVDWVGQAKELPRMVHYDEGVGIPEPPPAVAATEPARSDAPTGTQTASKPGLWQRFVGFLTGG